MSNVLIWAGGLLALLLYVPLIRIVLKGGEQSFATWLLWVLLDAIAMVSTILEKGNSLLLIFYVIGGSTVTVLLLYKKLFKWTWFEWLILTLVIICLVVWKAGGSGTAIVASSLAVFIAGVPQIVELWQKPSKEIGCVYLGYAVAALLSLLGGQGWTIEERFYPGVCAVLCCLISLASFRRLDTQVIRSTSP
jgi:hypothetical protein